MLSLVSPFLELIPTESRERLREEKVFGVKRAVIKMGRTQASEVAHICICVEKGRALQGGVQRAGIRYDVRTRVDSLQTLESLHLGRRSENPQNPSLNISSCKSGFKTMGVSQSQEMVLNENIRRIPHRGTFQSPGSSKFYKSFTQNEFV